MATIINGTNLSNIPWEDRPAADTVVALAFAQIDELIEFIQRNSEV